MIKQTFFFNNDFIEKLNEIYGGTPQKARVFFEGNKHVVIDQNKIAAEKELIEDAIIDDEQV